MSVSSNQRPCGYGRQLGPDGRDVRPANILERDVNVVWTVGMEEMLIYFVRANRMLWDPKHPHFTKPMLKRRKVEDIAAIIKRESASHGELNITAEDVWKKYRNLRNSFLREVKRTSDIRRERGIKTHTSSWVHFNRMRFLLSSLKLQVGHTRPDTSCAEEGCNRSSMKEEIRDISAAIRDESERLQQESQEEVRVGGEWETSEGVAPSPTVFPGHEGAASSSSSAFTRPTKSTFLQPVQLNYNTETCVSAKKRSEPSSTRTMRSDDLERAAKVLRSLEKDPDIAECFGKFVAASIRKLPEENQHALMSKITQVMSEHHTINLS